MKLIFDYQIFLAQPYGGISRYFCNLIKDLKHDNDLEISLPIHNHNNEYLKKEPEIIDIHSTEKSFFDFLRKPDHNSEITKKVLQNGDFDIFHATYYSDYFLKDLSNKPFVITIHDMIYELFPELFPLKDRTAFLKKDLALKADKIIVVSEKTKEDLLKFIDVKEDKIAVIYQACSLDKAMIDNHRNSAQTSNDYLLFVGNRTGYKNFYFMILAISDVLKTRPNLDLVCFGAPFNKKEQAFINNLGLAAKVKTVSGGDAELIGLYKNAKAFLSPSYYEGFGVTILEAFACGCPVLAANASATPEAAADAALYFDAKDPISVKNAVEKILNSEELRADLVAKGYQQNEKFSWTKAAMEMKEAYKSVL